MKKKDVSKINDSVYYESDEHVDTISDSSKQVDPRNDPIKETHIVDGVCTLSVGVGIFKPSVIEVIGKETTDIVTKVLTNSSEQLSMKSLSPLNMYQSKKFMIGSACDSVGVDRNIVFSSQSVGNHSRIGTPGVNKYIFSPSRDTTSNLMSCKGNIEPFNTHVHGSAIQEWNLNSSCIEELLVKSVLS